MTRGTLDVWPAPPQPAPDRRGLIMPLGSDMGREDMGRVRTLECGAGHPDRIATFCTRNRNHLGEHLCIPDIAHPLNGISWPQRPDPQASAHVHHAGCAFGSPDCPEFASPAEPSTPVDNVRQLETLLLSLLVMVIVLTLPALVIGAWRWAL